MLDEPFRRWLGRSAAAPARALHRLGVTPDQVTVAGALLGLAAAVLIAYGAFAAGLLTWIVGRILDGYDEMLARVAGRTTLFGGFLDITLDMLAYSAMAVGFAVAMPGDRTLWLFVLLGYVMAITTTLALSSLLERADRELGGDRSLQFTAAPAEGGETTVVYVLIALAPAWSRPVLALWLGLLAATFLHRLLLAAKLLR